MALNAFPDEARIRKLLDTRAAAIRAKDVAAALSPWTPEVVNYDLAPPLQYVGAEAHNPKRLTDWFGTWKGPIGYDLHDFSVRAREDVSQGAGCGNRLPRNASSTSESWSMRAGATGPASPVASLMQRNGQSERMTFRSCVSRSG
jgi:ketosteroid isomerase-like protein